MRLFSIYSLESNLVDSATKKYSINVDKYQKMKSISQYNYLFSNGYNFSKS